MMISLVGCSSGDKEIVKDVPTADLMEAALSAGEFPGLRDVQGEELIQLYHLNKDDIEEAKVNMPMMNVQAHEIAIIKVKDGKVDAVKESIGKRHEDIYNIWSQYLPNQFEMVKNKIIGTKGNYVYMIIAEDATKIENAILEKLK